MKRELFNYETEKLIILTLLETTLIIETGKIGKLRVSQKEFSSLDEALSAFEKKEWESIKKGFVYHNPNASKGEAVLHKFISKFYTGALSFVQAKENYFIYGAKKAEDNADFLLKINQQGKTENVFTLPKPLAWQIEFQETTNQLLLNLDRKFYTFSVENEKFQPTTEKIKKFSPCKRFWVECKGKTINIFDAQNNELRSSIKTQYGYMDIEWVAFSERFLIVNDLTFNGLKFYELETFKQIDMSGLKIPEEFAEVNSFCISPDERYLVQQQYSWAYVFDLQQEKFLYSFKIQHLVKSCQMQFLTTGLGIRTDYGCFSIYKI